MELIKIENIYINIIRNGNDKNGNPLYLVAVFEENNGNFYNYNYLINQSGLARMNKKGFLTCQSYIGSRQIAQEFYNKLQEAKKKADLF